MSPNQFKRMIAGTETGEDTHALAQLPARVNDRAAILFASPLIGISVGWASGVMHDAPPGGAPHWLSILFLSAIAYVLWLGNRTLYYWQRDRLAGTKIRPSSRRRMLTLVAMSVAFSAPTAYAAHVVWYVVFNAGDVNWTAVHAAAALVTVTSLFFANAYEAILLVREQARDRKAMEDANQQRLEAEVYALESQLDPHFIYNALCSLGFLIETNRSRAGAYVARLSSVYAYVTQNFTERVVELNEELAFARAFAELLRIRHADAIVISIPENSPDANRKIVPMSIQIALENAAKHNVMSREKPLRIDVTVGTEHVEVVNNKRPLAVDAVSHGVGLPNLSNRCNLCLGRDIDIIDTTETFTIRIPTQSGVVVARKS